MLGPIHRGGSTGVTGNYMLVALISTAAQDFDKVKFHSETFISVEF